jgi:hypothetical protein
VLPFMRAVQLASVLVFPAHLTRVCAD